MSAICARLTNQGKVGVQRGRKTAGCPSFLPTAVGTASPPRRAPRRSRRPQTANPPLRFSEKLPARKGRTRCRSSRTPAVRCRKRSRPVRANTLTQFEHPRSAGAEKEPPCQGEHARAVRAPRFSGAEKAPLGKGEHAHAVRVPRSAGAKIKLNCFSDNATAKRHTQAETA